MDYIIPRKLISWNINFDSVYLEFLNLLSWKAIEKISNILLGIRYSGTYKFYYNWNNSSETAPNSIFKILFQRLTLS